MRRRQEGGRTRPPAGRPTSSSSSHTRSRRPESAQQRSFSQQLLWLFGALIASAVFYLTPVSEIITREILLPLVPLNSDFELGRQALLELPSKDISRSSWSPLLNSVSHELIDTLKRSSGNGQKSEIPSSSSSYKWNVGIVRSDAINAFALPGGVIRVTDTLLEALQPTRGELAALIGHEMGHVLHRHSQARMLQTKVVSWIVQALVYEDHDENQETFGEALGELLTKSAAWLGQQRFSRLDEYQADATSWQLLVDASKEYGYNPQSLQGLLQKLWNLETGRSENKAHIASVIEDWSRTHPATKDRIDALDKKWKTLPAMDRKRLGSLRV
jgi:predicted Zn-dependent protease